MESPQLNLTNIIKQVLSDPRVVDIATKVLSEILQTAEHVDENADTQTVEQSASQPTVRPITPQKKTQKVVDWDSKTKPQLYAAYHYRKKNNIPFEPEFEAALIKRLPGYNPETKLFTGRNGKRKKESDNTDIQTGATTTQPENKERVINWDEKSDKILWQAYEHRKATGIDDRLHATLTRRFPNEYDPATRTRIKKVKTHDFGTKKPKESASPAIQRRAVPPVKKDASSKNPTRLFVKLKLTKQSLNTAFYDVYINGKKILHNHADTEVKLFADGTLLGIHGTVTNNGKLPQRPLWLIYKTDTSLLKWPGYTTLTKYDIYVRNIGASESNINLALSDNSFRQLPIERVKQQAGLKRFEIER